MGEWWETFFDDAWLKAGFGLVTRSRTLSDVRFITKVLSLEKKSRVLDVCCGTGRHAIELARLGYNVTGADLTRQYLAVARERARRRGVRISFELQDMRHLPYKAEFDAAICMWTSFGYFEKEADNLKALKAVNRALKPGGRFLIEVVNRDWTIVNFEATGWYKVAGGYVLEKRNLDTLRSRINSEWTYTNGGRAVTKNLSLRVYSPHELVDLLGRAGFRLNALFGDKQARTPTWEHRMTAVLARKQDR